MTTSVLNFVRTILNTIGFLRDAEENANIENTPKQNNVCLSLLNIVKYPHNIVSYKHIDVLS